MPEPVFHSITWYDREVSTGDQAAVDDDWSGAPQELVGETLYVWVTYPAGKKSKRRKASTGKRSNARRKLRLWAVAIVDAVNCSGDYRFDVALRTVIKHEEGVIRFWVRNDPREQSDNAKVFGVSSTRRPLIVLEEQLVSIAAKRVHDAIATTWTTSLSETGK